ncbi:Putative glyoxalase/Bleomycin resistance protein/Dihydroxybiphenyl dioxygenase [Colletotrichum destructivum]|uniref:Glyoxalase/Bleomycin resistance protein/Dihydroxybiphenyl dioxygenase n=1 Tax=Colletotrichum destructivum TaxID=34406 RepID=A0AAX4IZZ1_9PEZI|nr:Putative glyoxalase/Bleomycin resistance protein/Dihydroxybiphenyl dioxygenase [Colletotrichum destructivum]
MSLDQTTRDHVEEKAFSASSADGPYGQMCFLEVPVSDPARAAAFYTAVLGWECADAGMPSPTPGIKTVHFFNKGDLHGGFLAMEDGNHVTTGNDAARPARMAVLPTFCIRDIEATVVEVERLGGRVHVPKTEIGGGMGFFCRIIDCEGNMVGIWAQE